VINMAAGEARAGNHAALMYRDVRELTAASAFLTDTGAPADASAVLVVATRPILECLLPTLAGYGNTVRSWDLTSLGTDPGRVLAAIRMFASQHRDRPVRCFQEVGWPGRREDELAEAIRYDALVGTALAGSAAEVLCGYQVQIKADFLARAQMVHPAVIQEGRVRASAIVDSAVVDSALAGQPPDEALSSPPRWAAALRFRHDQATARGFAAEQARRAGLPPDRLADLQIAVGELTANTLHHTTGPGELTIWTADNEVVCQISDTGQITDPLAGTLRPDPVAPGSNRGLWLVHQVSDLVQVRTGPSGTTVRLHLRLPPAAR
jgi:anti-sigma regulatory factor (Ser/Thr protein kinase)